MSDILIKNEIKKLIRESGFKKSPDMICPIMRLFKMRYSNVDSAKVYTIANKLLR